MLKKWSIELPEFWFWRNVCLNKSFQLIFLTFRFILFLFIARSFYLFFYFTSAIFFSHLYIIYILLGLSFRSYLVRFFIYFSVIVIIIIWILFWVRTCRRKGVLVCASQLTTFAQLFQLVVQRTISCPSPRLRGSRGISGMPAWLCPWSRNCTRAGRRYSLAITSSVLRRRRL